MSQSFPKLNLDIFFPLTLPSPLGRGCAFDHCDVIAQPCSFDGVMLRRRPAENSRPYLLAIDLAGTHDGMIRR